MYKGIFLVSLLILTGCAEDTSPLTPFQCRVTGVLVEDNDTVTGTIRNEFHYDNVAMVRAKCQKPFEDSNYGCTLAITEGVYDIVAYQQSNTSIRYQTPKNHERCHAYYEEWRHLD